MGRLAQKQNQIGSEGTPYEPPTAYILYFILFFLIRPPSTIGANEQLRNCICSKMCVGIYTGVHVQMQYKTLALSVP